jgi:NTE family protein
MQEGTIFDGLPEGALEAELQDLERRHFPAGTVVLAEGESTYETYVVERGTADVFVSDRHGVEARIGAVVPGSTIGEMSVLTGEPAVATVRATADLEVLVLSQTDFERLAAKYPLIYRNVGVLLSDRLDRSNRRPFRDVTGRVTVLRDLGAPPLLGYALACSMAWHLRRPTLLLVLDDAPAEELAALARAMPRPRFRFRRARGTGDTGVRRSGDASAELTLLTSALGFTADTLAVRIEDLCASYEHVLVQVRGEAPILPDCRSIELAGPDRSRSVAAGHELQRLCAWVDGDPPPRPDEAGVLGVPALRGGDEQGIRNGALAPGTSAGRTLGWAARDLAGLKVGLALGGGAARGYAHCGVLRVLEDAGVPIDYLAGTSIGGAVAALRGLGLDTEEQATALTRVGSRAFRIRWPRSALLSSAGIRALIRDIFGEKRLEELELPVAVTAVDLGTRQEIVFGRGLIWSALMASMAIPGIFPPQRIGPYMLVDGGILNPVPSSVAANMGAGVVISVNLGRFSPSTGDLEAGPARSGGASVLYVIMRSLELQQSRIWAETAAAAQIVISPLFEDTTVVNLRHFREGMAYVEVGEAAAEAALPRVAAALPWLRSDGR